jgi:hypothetical protein
MLVNEKKSYELQGNERMVEKETERSNGKTVTFVTFLQKGIT